MVPLLGAPGRATRATLATARRVGQACAPCVCARARSPRLSGCVLSEAFLSPAGERSHGFSSYRSLQGHAWHCGGAGWVNYCGCRCHTERCAGKRRFRRVQAQAQGAVVGAAAAAGRTSEQAHAHAHPPTSLWPRLLSGAAASRTICLITCRPTGFHTRAHNRRRVRNIDVGFQLLCGKSNRNAHAKLDLRLHAKPDRSACAVPCHSVQAGCRLHLGLREAAALFAVPQHVPVE